jgi:hypothetical protein
VAASAVSGPLNVSATGCHLRSSPETAAGPLAPVAAGPAAPLAATGAGPGSRQKATHAAARMVLSFTLSSFCAAPAYRPSKTKITDRGDLWTSSFPAMATGEHVLWNPLPKMPSPPSLRWAEMSPAT